MNSCCGRMSMNWKILYMDRGVWSVMKTFIVYCHPSENSFTKSMCDAFIKGVVDSGNEYILSDLYNNYICQGFVVLGYIDGEQSVSKPRKPGRVQIIE